MAALLHTLSASGIKPLSEVRHCHGSRARSMTRIALRNEVRKLNLVSQVWGKSFCGQSLHFHFSDYNVEGVRIRSQYSDDQSAKGGMVLEDEKDKISTGTAIQEGQGEVHKENVPEANIQEEKQEAVERHESPDPQTALSNFSDYNVEGVRVRSQYSDDQAAKGVMVLEDEKDKISTGTAIQEGQGEVHKENVLEANDIQEEKQEAVEKHESPDPPTALIDSQQEKQEMDWKLDDDFKKFMGNPSIEAALKLEKKRAEQRLLELQKESGGNIFKKIFSGLVKNALVKEKERLEKAEATFKALDLNKLKSCFGYDTFYAVDVRRFGDGGIFIGNLRRPLEEVKSKLEQKLTEAAGREVIIWFMEEKINDMTKQVCVVQPKAEIDLQYEYSKLSTFWGYFSAALLGVTTFGTIALMSGFFLQPNATTDDYVSRVLPLFGGFITIIGVSEVATRWVASSYGVKLSPSFLIPSSWTGCLGVVNNFESMLPNKKALFDIAATRTTSAYAASFFLALIAFWLDGSLNGGENALYIRPQFFYNNPLLSFIQYVIGPYSDELGNVLPQAVPGVGVPVDPLAFAGLLGMVVTSLNLLPCGKLEGGRIAQALLGRKVASALSVAVSLGLGIGGLTGSILCLVWGFVATFFRGGEELPAQDEITPLGQGRYIWGYILAVLCFLTLFPNSAGTFPSAFYTPPFFRGDF